MGPFQVQNIGGMVEFIQPQFDWGAAVIYNWSMNQNYS